MREKQGWFKGKQVFKPHTSLSNCQCWFFIKYNCKKKRNGQRWQCWILRWPLKVETVSTAIVDHKNLICLDTKIVFLLYLEAQM